MHLVYNRFSLTIVYCINLCKTREIPISGKMAKS